MVIPFSNTKLRVPKGFQSLLVGLSTEVLRSQPRNIHEFAADYFEKLLKRRDQGQTYLPEKQSSLEDRYYNNQSFQDEYPVNDPEVNHAATKIQAKFRGHKARRNVEKLKQENQQETETERSETSFTDEKPMTPVDIQSPISPNDNRKTSPLPSSHSEKKAKEEDEKKIDYTETTQEPDQTFPEEKQDEEQEEQERAARSIQARFRGFQARKSANKDRDTPEQQQNQGSDYEKTSTPSTARQSGKLDSDRLDLSQDLTGRAQHETGEDDDTDRPRLEREPTQLSEDFERHTQIPRDLDFNHEERPDLNADDDDMNDPNLEKAATRIQASYRGYRTRKELGSADSQDQQQPPTSTSPHPHDEHKDTHTKVLSPSVEGNKEPEVEEEEEDDTAAAIKIQAAYRGYKIRKELEK